ncbi:MAG TPA: HNH endonuclease [Longimicrobiales bacterium]|nr:HNH endonuclease [Longimicrobiales bacterium]
MTPKTSLTSDEVRARFHDLGVWERDERAPYKPLLLLYVLGRYAHGSRRLIEFRRIEEDLAKLCAEFGKPNSAKHNPVAPFWELLQAGVWEVPGSEKARTKPGAAPTRAWLAKYEVAGGLTPELFGAVAGDPDLLRDVAGDLLEAHFPGTLHPEIMAAVKLDPAMGIPPSRRDPKFRAVVLKAYEAKCALCAFDARMGDSLVGLEAAYVRWHQAGGPSTVSNGMALCSLHHKLFDRGAFTLTHDRRVVVSAELHGTAATEQWITRHHGSKLRLPRRSANHPDPAHVDWHRREVFREPARPLT